MKATVFGLFGGTVVAFVFWSVAGRGLPATAGKESVYQPTGELITLNTMVEHEGADPAVDGGRSAVAGDERVSCEWKVEDDYTEKLRSISHDLDPMLEFNAANPRPSASRATSQR